MRINFYRRLNLVFLGGLLGISAIAHTAPSAKEVGKSTQQEIQAAQKVPLFIDARGGLKCDRAQQKCTARKNVRVQKGIFVMYCDELEAFIRKLPDGKRVVRRIDARGRIRFSGAESEKGSATRAVYDLDSNNLTLFGRKGGADGSPKAMCERGLWPVVQRDQHVICARVLKVLFEKNPAGRNRIKAMKSEWGTVFSTPTKFSTCYSAFYDVDSKQAILRKDVVLDGQEGQVKGPYGLLDLARDQHQILRVDPFKGGEQLEKPMAFVRVQNIDRKALKPKVK